jgi:hypothetical protein
MLLHQCHGGGETLIVRDIVDVTRELLGQGHYVALTTNGTVTARFDEIAKFPRELSKRLQITFSLHYTELLRCGFVDVFFGNIKKVSDIGCSFSIRLNVCDEYLPYLEEIKQLCILKTGALPHALPSVDFTNQDALKRLTTLSDKEYREVGRSFRSTQFDFKNSILFVKQKKFCYAGDWFFYVDLATGWIRKCYSEELLQNIYSDVHLPIRFEAIGNYCNSPYCEGCCFILPFGLMPALKTPTALQLFERAEAKSHTEEMRRFLSQKLYESNKQYSPWRKFRANLPYYKKMAQRLRNTSIFKMPKTDVTVTAMNSANDSAEGCEIVIKKISVDRKTYKPQELFSEGWLPCENGGLRWNNYTKDDIGDTIMGVIPEGRHRTIVFEKNKWRGMMKMVLPERQQTVDCYCNADDDELVALVGRSSVSLM